MRFNHNCRRKNKCLFGKQLVLLGIVYKGFVREYVVFEIREKLRALGNGFRLDAISSLG